MDGAPVLLEEMERYPAGFFSACRLRQIVLSGALCSGTDLSFGIAHLDDGGIDLYVRRDGPAAARLSNMPYAEFRSTIHHEIFHLFDEHRLGKDDRLKWEAANPTSFRYGLREKTGPLAPGFLSLCAMASPDEDRAEVFAYLMVNYQAVEQLAEEDSIVRSKVGMIKSMLRRSCPKIDDAFWQEVERRSQRFGNPLSVVLARGWKHLEPGIDPANPSAERADSRLLLRPTECPGCPLEAVNVNAITRLDVPLRKLVALAYNCPSPLRVVDLAGLGDTRYDLIASTGAGGLEQIQSMLRDHLERQFAIQVSREIRPTDVLILTLAPGVGKGPPPPASALPATIPAPEISFQDWRPDHNEKRIGLIRIAPSALAVYLENMCEEIDRPVVDEAHTEFFFSTRFDYKPESLESLRIALRGCGLVLEPGHRQLEVLVVRKRHKGR